MSLNPIKALNEVIEDYKGFILTEFRAKDPDLKKALEDEIEKPGFLAQEPFYQAHRPFKDGKKWEELPIKIPLALTLAKNSDKSYIHQSAAIEQLLGSSASNMVVTTGTGSGKSECFLIPVIQNAIEDSLTFEKSGLTAILVYPMNALANDQLERIDLYLEGAGFKDKVIVKKYDRSTSQADREEMRRNPPHILLTNYMMLEYLLVRPSDRDAIFANHRCRFFVLDEVHTYRGALGANIAFLVRRLKEHLNRATQVFLTDPGDQLRDKRFPKLLCIGTSATIKSDSEEGLPKEEAQKKRDEGIKEFFSKLTGEKPDSIKVLGEELKEITTPDTAQYSASMATDIKTDFKTTDDLRLAVCKLAGLTETTGFSTALSKCRILWDLNALLIKKPMSIGQIATKIKETVPARNSYSIDDIVREVRLAILIGSYLSDGHLIPLKLKAHQFVRGGWKFYRCVDPKCGRIYPKGEEQCSCGARTAPLYICRYCGADYLRFSGDERGGDLAPDEKKNDKQEWLLYLPAKFGEVHDEEEEEGEDETPPAGGRKARPKTVKGKNILTGSFDPASLTFLETPGAYPLKAMLMPARTRCLCCGGSASRNIVSPVSLGTSAAIKVLTEGTIKSLEDAHTGEVGRDQKERILIFSDSRQDAAHQARFIKFANRYDRMRRRVYEIVNAEKSLTIQRTVELLSEKAVKAKDNPRVPDNTGWIPAETKKYIGAFEEAPLLDDVSVNTGFRATVINLGLVGIEYHELMDYIKAQGQPLCAALGISEKQLHYLCTQIMDKMRCLGTVNREMLRYHVAYTSCPKYILEAEWERSMKSPKGFTCKVDGEGKLQFTNYIHRNEYPEGIQTYNFWQSDSGRGKKPAIQVLFETLLGRFGGKSPTWDLLEPLLVFLSNGFITAEELFGHRDSRPLIQVNENVIHLKETTEATRFKCNVCGLVVHGEELKDYPCPECHGSLVTFTDLEVDESRYVKRIKMPSLPNLEAAEHTAQVSNDDRERIEDNFKANFDVNRLNVLACSPTLEMGIDVGGLDAVLMRNVPPRPDNYAQRGGRAGRRQRIGLVVGYARNTPHDQYFYDHPEEMIAGEVFAPQVSLANRDIIFRHINAVIFGSAQPGLSGKMVDYVNPMGEIVQEKVDELLAGVASKVGDGISLSKAALGEAVLTEAGLSDETLSKYYAALPDKIKDIFNRTSRQVKELRAALDRYYRDLLGVRTGQRSGEMTARLLGIQGGTGRDADDRSSGYPMRRFAEFGILPGYEFPSQPASLRLLGDPKEADLISVVRRFGIAQYQPGAQVYARAKRWKVIGLDTASPWNPFGAEQGWGYKICEKCKLRFDAGESKCPRCGDALAATRIPAVEYAGFIATRDEAPVLDEEERFSVHASVLAYPQWNGDIVNRWETGPGWGLRLSRGEDVIWMNEGKPPSPADLRNAVPLLHNKDNSGVKGFSVCPECGRLLRPAAPPPGAAGAKKRGRVRSTDNPYDHARTCSRIANAESPIALYTKSQVEILRLIVPVPEDILKEPLMEWGLSLGYSLRAGMRHRYSLDGGEVEFFMEGPWETEVDGNSFSQAALSFIDPHIGGSGYLPKIVQDFDKIAQDAINYLKHDNCQTSCYRCLKAYTNQRFHEFLKWPRIISDLETLATMPSRIQPAARGDIKDPKPWLEAYAAGVGSPLELKFLRLFEAHGLKVDKQVPVAPKDGEPNISIPDFLVPGKRIAIYVDGAAFHVGANLRRDRYIREKLKAGTPPWRIVELRASDLARGTKVAEDIENL